MRVGGGVVLVEGPMGAGKSLNGVRTMIRALAEDMFVVSNVPLGIWYDGVFHPMEGWAERAAFHYAWHKSRRRRAELAKIFSERYVYTEKVSEAFTFGVKRRRGRSLAPGGVVVWDETHNDLNNRTWRGGRRHTAEDREELLERVTQLRKLGMIGYLLSQHADNTDKGLRRIANWHVYLFNQSERVRLPVVGVRVAPVKLFLAYWVESSAHQEGPLKAKPVAVERYPLSWHRRIYDTHGLYHGLADLDDNSGVVWLDEPRVAIERTGAEAPPPIALGVERPMLERPSETVSALAAMRRARREPGPSSNLDLNPAGRGASTD